VPSEVDHGELECEEREPPREKCGEAEERGADHRERERGDDADERSKRSRVRERRDAESGAERDRRGRAR
jgi:hypothetical protein